MKRYIFFSFMAIFFVPSLAFANADIDIVTKIINEFNSQTSSWYTIAQKFALNLFYVVVTFELVRIGIVSLFSNNEIHESLGKLVMMIIVACFFLACINNYQEWSTMLIRGLYTLAGDMTKLETNSANPFLIGLEIIKKINQRVEGLSWRDMGLIVSMYLASFIILICFSLITAKIICIKCEAMIATVVALALIPLGASELFREYGINTIRYILSVAFKLFALQLVVGIGFDFIESFKFTNTDMADIAVILGFVVVLLAISQVIPDTVSGIINGSHIGSGAGLGSAMNTTKNLLTSTVGGAITGGLAGYRAGKIARATGATGVKAMAMGTFTAMREASHQASMRKTTMSTVLKDRLNTIKELQNN